MSVLTWLPAVAIGAVSTILVPIMAARPLSASIAAGVFPPWWSNTEIVSAAARAGSIVGSGTLPFVIIVRVEEGEAAQRLSEQGALFSLDPSGAPLCARIERQ